jgi:hypothetical protein
LGNANILWDRAVPKTSNASQVRAPQLVDTAISALWTPAYLRLVAGRDIVILTESDSNGNKTTV